VTQVFGTLRRKSLEFTPYYTTGTPSGTLVAAPDAQVPSQTGYVYDGAGRVVRQISYKLASRPQARRAQRHERHPDNPVPPALSMTDQNGRLKARPLG